MGNLEHTYAGRLWRETGRKPYVNRQGEAVELVRWQTRCAKCETLIECTTPKAFETSKAFGLKHCAVHKDLSRGARIA